MQFILLIVLAQALYSSGDLVRKFILHGQNFDLTLLKSLPMWLTMVLSVVAFVIQLFVMKHYDLSRTITILACCAIVFSVALGVIILGGVGKCTSRMIRRIGVVPVAALARARRVCCRSSRWAGRPGVRAAEPPRLGAEAEPRHQNCPWVAPPLSRYTPAPGRSAP